MRTFRPTSPDRHEPGVRAFDRTGLDTSRTDGPSSIPRSRSLGNLAAGRGRHEIDCCGGGAILLDFLIWANSIGLPCSAGAKHKSRHLDYPSPPFSLAFTMAKASDGSVRPPPRRRKGSSTFVDCPDIAAN